MMNMVFIEFYMAKRNLLDDDEEFTEKNIKLFYHTFFTLFNKFHKEYGKMILCWEGKNSLEWRKNIYPEYKRNRDGKKKEEEYKLLIRQLKPIREALEYFPVKQISVEGAEADDVIFTLAMYYDEPHTIVSTDKDFVQILKYKKNISLYNPIKKSFAKYHPYLVEEKAIVGDRSDNISGLYRVGIKKFEKMINDRSEFNKIMEKSNNREVYEKLLKIIDLRQIPKELKQKIVDKEKEKCYTEFNKQALEGFFFEHRLKELLMRW